MTEPPYDGRVSEHMITALLFPVPVLGDKEATEDTFDHALEDSVATITIVGGGLPQG